MSFFDQAGYSVRCERGASALEYLTAEIVVIVDVLSFTTCVEVATTRGAQIFRIRGNMTPRPPMRERNAPNLLDPEATGKTHSPWRPPP